MYIGELIKKYRTEHSLSMQDFSKIAGVSKAYIGVLEKIYNAKTGEPVAPTLDKMKSIAAAMGLSLDELLKLLDETQPVVVNNSPSPMHTLPPSKPEGSVMIPIPGGYKVPVLGRVVAGVPLTAIREILDWEEIPERLGRTGEIFGLEIRGQSMEPTLYEGDVVLVRQQPEVENGEMAIVLINGDDATVKEIKESSNGLLLIGHNTAVYTPHFYTAEEVCNLPIQILGKVVELRRKF